MYISCWFISPRTLTKTDIVGMDENTQENVVSELKRNYNGTPNASGKHIGRLKNDPKESILETIVDLQTMILMGGEPERGRLVAEWGVFAKCCGESRRLDCREII